MSKVEAETKEPQPHEEPATEKISISSQEQQITPTQHLQTKYDESHTQFENMKNQVRNLRVKVRELEERKKETTTKLEIMENVECVLESEIKEVLEWQQNNKKPSELRQEIIQKQKDYENLSKSLEDIEHRCSEKLASLEDLISNFLD